MATRAVFANQQARYVESWLGEPHYDRQTLTDEVYDNPAILPQLDVIQTQRSYFAPA